MKQMKQEYLIKQVPVEDVGLLETTLNEMSDSDWELYSIYEAEHNSKIVYNCLFVREAQTYDEFDDDDIIDFKSKVERMLYSKEEPYELCLNLQKKIRDKKAHIERVKKFLESSKDKERELLNEEIKKDIDDLNTLKKDLKEVVSPSKMSKYLGEEKLSISLSSNNYRLCDTKRVENLLAQTVKVRQQLANSLGYIIPKVQFIENSSLEEFEFTINIHGIPIVSSYAYPDYIAYFEDELNIDKAPKNSIKVKDTLTGKKLIWIKKEDCKNFWSEGITPIEYIGRYLEYYTIVHVDEIFDYNDLNRYIDFVSEQNSSLVDSIVGDYISVSELKYLLVHLIREQVSIKDITYIFEKLNDFADDPDKTDLPQRLRVALSRSISHNLANSDNEIFAYEISDKTLQTLEKQANKQEGIIQIDLSKFTKLKKNLKELMPAIIAQKAVIVAPKEYREVMFIIISQLYMDVPVICYEEVALDYEVKVIGTI